MKFLQWPCAKNEHEKRHDLGESFFRCVKGDHVTWCERLLDTSVALHFAVLFFVVHVGILRRHGVVSVTARSCTQLHTCRVDRVSYKISQKGLVEISRAGTP